MFGLRSMISCNKTLGELKAVAWQGEGDYRFLGCNKTLEELKRGET